jgi:hypothetical protein
VFKSGTADLNIVGPRWNCPAVGYGPGDSALDHTPEERLSLEEFARSIHVIGEVLLTLTQTARGESPRNSSVSISTYGKPAYLKAPVLRDRDP